MTTFQSASKSNRLLQSKRYTIADADVKEAYTRVLDLNSEEIYIQQASLPTSSLGLPYSGSAQNEGTILSGSQEVARYYYRIPLSPGSVNTSGRYQTWFTISGSSSAVSPQQIQDKQLVNWISNKYLAASQATRVAENANLDSVGYNVVISKGATAGVAVEEQQSIFQFDYKTGVVQYVGTSVAPLISEQIYLSGYVYKGQTLDQFVASGSGGGSGAGFPFAGDAIISGSLLVSGSGLTVSGSSVFSGSIDATSITGSLTGSLEGIAATASFVEASNISGTVASASNADTASYIEAGNIVQPFTSITSSGTISGSGLIESVGMTASFATFGTASVDHLVVKQLISGSVIITSGSNIFGDETSDTQTLIGNVKVSGSLEVSGSATFVNTLSLPNISDVSASIASAAEGGGVFVETGSFFATTNTLQVTGSTLESTPVPGAQVTSSGESDKYALLVSESVWHYNANVGVPRSNPWGSSGLAGSYFSNFDHNTDISEMLRFISGLLSSSAPDISPNTNTYVNISKNLSNTSAGTIPSGLVPQTATETTVAYLETQGFATDGQTLFNGVDLAGQIKGLSTFAVSYDAESSGNTAISSSDSFDSGSNTRLIGLGRLGNGLEVSGSLDFRFSNDTSNTETATSHSSGILSNSTIDTTSNGLTLATIETANPSVIPNTFQDGLFTNIFGASISNNGTQAFTDKESIGYYEISASITLQTGSGGYLAVKKASERILFSPLTEGSIANNTISDTIGSGSISLCTSRSLSGAPYLLTNNWNLSSSVSGLFNPLYKQSSDITKFRSTDSLVTLEKATNHTISASTNTGNIVTPDAVFDSTGTTVRAAGTVPFQTDIVKLSGSLAFNATDVAGATNITKTAVTPTTFNVTTRARNRQDSTSHGTTQTTSTFAYYDIGTFGQDSTSGSLAYYGRAQGYDGGTLQGTTEQFSGEDFRIKINDNLLSGSYADGDKFTLTYDISTLAKYDLQVKPGFLVYPGGTNGYWFDNPDSSTDYKYYARAFQVTELKGNLFLDVGQALKKWSESSDGIAAAVMFQSALKGNIVGSNPAIVRSKLYDFATLSGGDPATNQATSDQLNPFSVNIDVGGNQSGELSGTQYKLPLVDSLNQELSLTYPNFIILIRYKGAQTGGSLNPLDSSTYRINVSYS